MNELLNYEPLHDLNEERKNTRLWDLMHDKSLNYVVGLNLAISFYPKSDTWLDNKSLQREYLCERLEGIDRMLIPKRIALKKCQSQVLLIREESRNLQRLIDESYIEYQENQNFYTNRLVKLMGSKNMLAKLCLINFYTSNFLDYNLTRRYTKIMPSSLLLEASYISILKYSVVSSKARYLHLLNQTPEVNYIEIISLSSLKMLSAPFYF